MSRFLPNLILTAEELNSIDSSVATLDSSVSSLYEGLTAHLSEELYDKTSHTADATLLQDCYLNGGGGITNYTAASESLRMGVLTYSIPANTTRTKITNMSIPSDLIAVAFYNSAGGFLSKINVPSRSDTYTDTVTIPEEAVTLKFSIRLRLLNNVTINNYYMHYYDVFGLHGDLIVDNTVKMDKLGEDWHNVFDEIMIDTIISKDLSNKATYEYNFKNANMSDAVGPGSTVNPQNYSWALIAIPEHTVTIELNKFSIFANGVRLIYLDKDNEVISAVTGLYPGYDVNEILTFDNVPENARYIVFNLRTSGRNKIYCKVYVTGTKALNPAIWEGGGGGGTSSTIYELTVDNSDKIAFIGDSYTESAYGIENKSYVAKISLFSDFLIVNFGVSGDVFAGRMYDIRRKQAKYGTVTFDEYKPKYAVLTCYTNDIKYMDNQAFLGCVENIIKVLKGIGTTPIVATEYHTGSGNNKSILRTGLRKIAKDYGLLFFDIASICDLIYNGIRFAKFWGSSHPGSRANALESDSFLEYLDDFERPSKSIKIFRPRHAELIDIENINLDDYMFDTKYERAKVFKEIIVGANGLRNASDVDNVTDNAGGIGVEQSEYGKLMTDTYIPFNNMALISTILPYDNHNLTMCKLTFDIINGEEDEETTDAPLVYVMNTMQSPWPIPSRYSNFYISLADYEAIGSGNTFTCAEDGKTYTYANKLMYDDGTYHLYATPADYSPAQRTGTLTRVSDSRSIAYTYREGGYLPGVLNEDTCGHYTRIMPDPLGAYDISTYINGAVKVDQVNWLILYDGEFKLKNIKVTYQGDIPKNIVQHEHRFVTNYYNDSTEILPVTTFTTLGTNSTYGCTVTDLLEYINYNTRPCPLGCKYCVALTDQNKITYTVPSSNFQAGRTYILEMWCRYFPDIYGTTGATNVIDVESFDYNKVYVKLFDNTVYTFYANTHWKILRLPIEIYNVSNMKIEIYSDSLGMELAYISLKKK